MLKYYRYLIHLYQSVRKAQKVRKISVRKSRNIDIAFIDKDGTAHKPFVVPQADPEYYLNSLKSYNVPEFIAEPVTLERRDIIEMAQEGVPVKVTVRQ